MIDLKLDFQNAATFGALKSRPWYRFIAALGAA
jgi:hypothetical protein